MESPRLHPVPVGWLACELSPPAEHVTRTAPPYACRVRVLVQPRSWAAHLLMVLALAAASVLGVWQLHVWQAGRVAAAVDPTTGTRRSRSDRLMGGDDAFPAAGTSGSRCGSPGPWLPQSTLYVADRELDGSAGYWVVTPVAASGGSAMPVVRGWSAHPRPRPRSPGRSRSTGWLQASEGTGSHRHQPRRRRHPRDADRQHRRSASTPTSTAASSSQKEVSASSTAAGCARSRRSRSPRSPAPTTCATCSTPSSGGSSAASRSTCGCAGAATSSRTEAAEGRPRGATGRRLGWLPRASLPGLPRARDGRRRPAHRARLRRRAAEHVPHRPSGSSLQHDRRDHHHGGRRGPRLDLHGLPGGVLHRCRASCGGR